MNRSGIVRWGGTGALVLSLCGCQLMSGLVGTEKSFVSNGEVLAAVARASSYLVSADEFLLFGAQVFEDSITFQYRGARFPGDHAWVVRYSEKSSEQDPVALADVYTLLPEIQAGRDGFALRDEGRLDQDGLACRFIRYRFDSPVRDDTGHALEAHGILASVRRESPGEPLIFQIKLDNHGDRPDAGWEDLKPFVEAVKG